MPLVYIRYNHSISQTHLYGILPTLCSTLARQLSCQDGTQTIKITPNMIKVRIDSGSEFDIHMPDLYIEVEARILPARSDKIDGYAKELVDALTPLLPKGIRVGVWLKLCNGDWYSEQL